MEHQGKKFKNLVAVDERTTDEIVKKMKVSRPTLYRMFSKKILRGDYLDKIAKAGFPIKEITTDLPPYIKTTEHLNVSVDVSELTKEIKSLKEIIENLKNEHKSIQNSIDKLIISDKELNHNLSKQEGMIELLFRKSK